MEDLDPESSGGELGVGQTVVMVSCNYPDVLIPHSCDLPGKKTQGRKSTGWPEGVEKERKGRRFWGDRESDSNKNTIAVE